MAGEKDLHLLLARMNPVLASPYYVFTTVADTVAISARNIKPKAMFVEQEGITLVLTETDAQAAKLPYEGCYQCITLNVHSSLEAVGLTAAVAVALAQENISANVMAAYYHDHVFIPVAQAKQALDILNALSQA